jgi:hypothetical protein
MHALSRRKGPTHPDYAIWSKFVGEMEAEQLKRAEHPS